MNEYDKNMIIQADSDYQSLEKHPELMGKCIQHYDNLFHQALISVYNPSQMDIKIQEFCQLPQRAQSTEIYSNYLERISFPNPLTYFCLVNTIAQNYYLSQFNIENCKLRILSNEITEQERFLLMKMLQTQQQFQQLSQFCFEQAKVLKDKQSLRKEREIIPRLLLLQYIQDESKILDIISFVFDKLKRHVSINVFYNQIACILNSSKQNIIYSFIEQQQNSIFSIIQDKKHFHCVFALFAEYSIRERSFLQSSQFQKYLGILKQDYILSAYSICRLVAKLCYNHDIFEQPSIKPQTLNQQGSNEGSAVEKRQLQNEGLQEIFVEMFSFLAKNFNNGICHLEKLYLTENIYSMREQYFNLLPYYQMQSREAQKVTLLMIQMMAQVIKCNLSYYTRTLSKGKLYDFVMIYVPQIQLSAIDWKSDSNINILSPLLRKHQLLDCEQVIHFLTKFNPNLYFEDVYAFFVNIQEKCNNRQSQEVIYLLLARIKHYSFFPKLIPVISACNFEPHNSNFIYIVISLLFTEFNTNQKEFDQLFIKMLDQVKFLKNSESSKYEIIKEFRKNKSDFKQEFSVFIEKQLAEDFNYHATYDSSITLLYFFGQKEKLLKQLESQLVIQIRADQIDNLIENYCQLSDIPDFKLGYADIRLNDIDQFNPDSSNDGANILQKIMQQNNDNKDNKDNKDLMFAYAKYTILYFSTQKSISLLSKYYNEQQNSISVTNSIFKLLCNTTLKYQFSLIVQLKIQNSTEQVVILRKALLALSYPFLLALLCLQNQAQLFSFLQQKYKVSKINDLDVKKFDDNNYYCYAVLFYFSNDYFFDFLNVNSSDKMEWQEALSYTLFLLYQNNFGVNYYEEKKTGKNYTDLQLLDYSCKKSFEKNCNYLWLLQQYDQCKLFEIQPVLYEKLIRILILSIRNNKQLEQVMAYYFNEQKTSMQQRKNELPFKYIIKLFDKEQFQLLKQYDFILRFDLKMLEQQIPKQQILNVYYYEAKYILDIYGQSDKAIQSYLNQQILRYDLSKNAEYYFDSRMQQQQSHQYFTIAQLLIMCKYLFNEQRKNCEELLQTILHSQIVSKLWVGILKQFVNADNSNNNLIIEQLNDISSFVPALLQVYVGIRRQIQEHNSFIDIQINEMTKSFLNQQFILYNDNFRFNPDESNSSFDSLSDASNNSSANSSINSSFTPRQPHEKEKARLSEGFLIQFLQYISICKSDKDIQILNKYFVNHYQDALIIQLIKLICHNQYFLSKFKIQQLNIGYHEKGKTIITRRKGSVKDEKESNSVAFQKERMQNILAQEKLKEKFVVHNIQELFQQTFDFNVIEKMVIDISESKPKEVLGILLKFTEMNTIKGQPAQLLIYNTQIQSSEFIYGLVARNILCKILQNVFSQQIKVQNELINQSLIVLYVKVIYVDVKHYDDVSQLNDSSMYQQSESSIYDSSSKQSKHEQQNVYSQVTMNIAEDYYFDQLFLGGKKDKQINACDRFKKYLEKIMSYKYFSVLPFCKELALVAMSYGIFNKRDLQNPWPISDQYYQSVYRQQNVLNMYYQLPFEGSEIMTNSLLNRTKIIRFIYWIIALNKKMLINYQQELQKLYVVLFNLYLNQILLMRYSTNNQLVLQQYLLETIILDIMDIYIQNMNIVALNQFSIMLNTCLIHPQSQSLAWKIFDTIFHCFDVAQCKTFYYIEDKNITPQQSFSFLLKQYDSPVKKYPKAMSASTKSEKLEATITQIRTMFLFNSRDKGLMLKKSDSSFYQQQISIIVKDLNWLIGTNITSEKLSAELANIPFAKCFPRFTLIKELIKDYFLAITLSQIIAIFFMKQQQPQYNVNEVLPDVVLNYRFLYFEQKSQYKEEQELDNYVKFLSSLDNQGQCKTTFEPQKIRYFTKYATEKMQFLQSLYYLLEYTPLQLFTLILITDICAQIAEDGFVEKVESLDFSHFTIVGSLQKEIQLQLISRYNYKNMIQPVYIMANQNYKQIQLFLHTQSQSSASCIFLLPTE